MANEIEEILTLEDYNTVISGGGYHEEIVTVIKDGEVFTPPLPDVPDLTKYEFTGFDVGQLSEITSSCNAVAQYKLIKHTVTFVTEYGTVSPQSVINTEKAEEPTIEDSPDNYSICGWYKDRYYSELYDFNQAVTNDITLYAKWEPNYIEIFSAIGENSGKYRVEIRKSLSQKLYYSTDKATWTEIATGQTTINANGGTSLYFRGTLERDNTAGDYTSFGLSRGDFSVSGDINTLWDYQRPYSPLKDYCGYRLFVDNPNTLKDVTNLTFPSETLSPYCYAEMFEYCNSITTSPKLMATNLTTGCYSKMFNGCAELNTITCNAIFGINQNNSTARWVDGVGVVDGVTRVGIIYKNSSASWPTGVNGIPEGWYTTNIVD